MGTFLTIIAVLALFVPWINKVKKVVSESMSDDNVGHTPDINEPENIASEGYNYFTYETLDNDLESAVHVKSQPQHVTQSEEEQEPFTFDLRQAVIYQTILNNKYISENKQLV